MSCERERNKKKNYSYLRDDMIITNKKNILFWFKF